MTGSTTRERTDGPVATGVAAALVRGWVELYTVGVSASAAERRREEIASDLWEHLTHAREAGTPRIAVSLSIAGRAASGIPADLLWAHTERAAMRSQPAEQKALRHMNSALRIAGDWWWALGAAVLSALVLSMGIIQLLQPGMPYLADSIQAILVGGLLAAGVVLKARMPRLAAALVVAGAATPAVLWWAPILMVLGLAVLLGAAVDLIRRLAQHDVTLGVAAVTGILAMDLGIVASAFFANETGPLALLWLGLAVAGAATLAAVAGARPRTAMRRTALA